jgi:Fur family ferric uptake transcriptional regulator
LTIGSSIVIITIENSFHLAIEMRLTEKKIASMLRQRGYKVTPQRRAVLNVIAHSHDHLTPAEIHERVHQEHPNIGLVTIYRTLGILAELELICEVHAGGSCRSYLLRRPSEHHHHLICSQCGAVVDFTNCDLGELEQRLSRETGFEIESHLLEFLGRCPNCQRG